MKVLLLSLLALTEKPYEEYNELLENIKTQLETPQRVALFEKTLAEELPLTTARRAYKTAIRVACGEKDVPREFHGHPAKHTKAVSPARQKWIDTKGSKKKTSPVIQK